MLSQSLNKLIKASYLGIFTADSLSMPVHWFYEVQDIKKTFGEKGIQKLEDVPDYHPYQFMKLEGKNGELIGKVIHFGKEQIWANHRHVHHGQKAGDNTLNSLCSQVVLRNLLRVGKFEKEEFLKDYVAFLTSNPAQFNDSYAEEFHRTFFYNFKQGKKLSECGEETQGTASVGGFVMIIPLVLFQISTKKTLDQILDDSKTLLYTTHPSQKLSLYCSNFVTTIYRIITQISENIDLKQRRIEARTIILEQAKLLSPSIDLQDILNKINNEHQGDNDPVFSKYFARHCAIDVSYPSLLFLAFRYLDPEFIQEPLEAYTQALLANTNVGGENCHRGSVLGSILGAAFGIEIPTISEKLLIYNEALNDLKQLENIQ